jgi:hypothetical protein
MQLATSGFPDYAFYPEDRLLAAFVEGPARLRRAVGGLDDDACRARPRGASRWSIQEIVLHTADSEAHAYVRVRKALAEPGAALPGYDQDAWVAAIDYRHTGRPERERALDLIDLLRRQTAPLLAAPASSGEAWGIHPQFGHLTLRNLLELYADHSERHLEQILECRRLLGMPLSIEPILARRLY